MKVKKLVKATALKRRYIACEIKFTHDDNGKNANEAEIKRAIYNEALRFFGEYLLSFVALKLVSYDQNKKIVILRCNRDFYGEVLGFLALINLLNGKKARAIAMATSGTIKGIGRKLSI